MGSIATFLKALYDGLTLRNVRASAKLVLFLGLMLVLGLFIYFRAMTIFSMLVIAICLGTLSFLSIIKQIEPPIRSYVQKPMEMRKHRMLLVLQLLGFATSAYTSGFFFLQERVYYYVVLSVIAALLLIDISQGHVSERNVRLNLAKILGLSVINIFGPYLVCLIRSDLPLQILGWPTDNNAEIWFSRQIVEHASFSEINIAQADFPLFSLAVATGSIITSLDHTAFALLEIGIFHGIMVPILMYYLTKRLIGLQVALTTSLIFVLLPTYIFYGIEFKSFGLGLGLTIVIFSLLSLRRERRLVILLTIYSIAIIYTHPVVSSAVGIIFFGMALGVLIQRTKDMNGFSYQFMGRIFLVFGALLVLYFLYFATAFAPTLRIIAREIEPTIQPGTASFTSPMAVLLDNLGMFMLFGLASVGAWWVMGQKTSDQRVRLFSLITGIVLIFLVTHFFSILGLSGATLVYRYYNIYVMLLIPLAALGISIMVCGYTSRGLRISVYFLIFLLAFFNLGVSFGSVFHQDPIAPPYFSVSQDFGYRFFAKHVGPSMISLSTDAKSLGHLGVLLPRPIPAPESYLGPDIVVHRLGLDAPADSLDTSTFYMILSVTTIKEGANSPGADPMIVIPHELIHKANEAYSRVYDNSETWIWYDPFAHS